MKRDLQQKQLEQEIKKEITEEYEVLMKQAEAREQAAKKRINQARNILTQNDSIKQQQTNKQQANIEDIIMEINEPATETIALIKPVQIQPTINQESPSVMFKVNDQTTEKEFKPTIRMQSNMNSNTMSPTTNMKTNIKMFENQHASIESKYENSQEETQKRIDYFKTKNTHGHASDSIIKDLMSQSKESVEITKKKRLELDEFDSDNQLDIDEKYKNEKFKKFTTKDNRISLINFEEIIQSYQTDFNFSNDTILDNILTKNLIKSNKMNENIERTKDAKLKSESNLIQIFS